MNTTSLPRRAPAVAQKLEAAREALKLHNNEVAQTVLDAAEGVSGAPKRLADLRVRISNAEREVGELEQAHTLALKLDRQSDAGVAAAMRAEQFAVMKKRGDARLKAAATVMEAVATMAKAYNEYAVASQDMVNVIPSGTRLGFISLGRNGYGGSWVGDLKGLIAAEAYRLAPIDARGRGARLPFAEQPEITTTDHRTIPPGFDLITEAQAGVFQDLEAQMERLNAEAMAQASKAAEEGKAA